MNTMMYGGYAARIEHDGRNHLFVGHLAGIRKIVEFRSSNLDKLEGAFHEAVDDYVQTCTKVGKAPETPYPGTLVMSMSPELHGAIAIAAHLGGKSINEWATDVLRNAALSA